MSTKKYTEEDLSNNVLEVEVATFMMTALFLTIAFGFFGAFDSVYDKLDLDKDALARDHVLEYYPEYENCEIIYKSMNKIDCKNGIDGV